MCTNLAAKNRDGPLEKSDFFGVVRREPNKALFEGGWSQSVRRVALTFPNSPHRPCTPIQPLCGQQEQKLATEASKSDFFG